MSSLHSSTLSRRSAMRLGSTGLVAVFGLTASSRSEAREIVNVDRSKALIRQVFEDAVNMGDLSIIEKLYAADFVDRSASIGESSGADGIAQRITNCKEQVPGLHVVMEALIAEADLVTSRVSWHGTHPPSGTHLVGRTLHFFRLSDGQIVEEWSAGWEWLKKLESKAPV